MYTNNFKKCVILQINNMLMIFKIETTFKKSFKMFTLEVKENL